MLTNLSVIAQYEMAKHKRETCLIIFRSSRKDRIIFLHFKGAIDCKTDFTLLNNDSSVGKINIQ